MTTWITDEIQESLVVTSQLQQCVNQIAEVGAAIVTALRARRKLIVFGNGGSAADAQHLAAEFVGRYRTNRRALAAVALTTDSSSLTAIANDFGFEQIFSRQIEAIGKSGDVVVAISTSGNSPNVLQAVVTAKKMGITSIGLTGRSGGELRRTVDICLCVPSDSTPRIQETHGLVVHILTGMIENALTVGD